MKVRWWERLLVEWAAFVMTQKEFDAFLRKYGFEINARLEVVRAYERSATLVDS